MADFIDVFLLGEGEENLLELIDLYELAKREKISKQEFLQKASHIKGAYVPSLYDVSYNEDGTIQKVTPLGGAPMPVEKAIIKAVSYTHLIQGPHSLLPDGHGLSPNILMKMMPVPPVTEA